MLEASNRDARRSALEQLCEAYWSPVFAYVCRRVSNSEDAKDLTQAFFARLLEKQSLRQADPGRGRFRSFLLGAARNFLANEWDRAHAQRRGGTSPTLSLDALSNGTILPEAATTDTPERAFERSWALLQLERALHTLRDQYEAAGRGRHFECLKEMLTGAPEAGHYQALAAELGMSESAVKMAVHRLRRRFREALHSEICRTVAQPEEADDELRYLMAVLRD